MHATILKYMFDMVEAGQLQAPLWEGRTDLTITPGMTNQTVRHWWGL
jgi:hypothetical protein